MEVAAFAKPATIQALMPQFSYQAVDSSGKDTSGTLEAADRAAAMRVITGKGMQPFKVTEVAAAPVKGAAPAKPKAAAKSQEAEAPTGPMRLSANQVQLFSEELSELLEAGMRLEAALRILEGKGRVPESSLPSGGPPHRQSGSRGSFLPRCHAHRLSIVW